MLKTKAHQRDFDWNLAQHIQFTEFIYSQQLEQHLERQIVHRANDGRAWRSVLPQKALLTMYSNTSTAIGVPPRGVFNSSYTLRNFLVASVGIDIKGTMRESLTCK